MKKTIVALALLILGMNFSSRADEGMWLPMFIGRLNYTDMQKMGLQLTPEEIYSVNNSSLKDAIVMLSGGSCTAEVISKDGLTLTNHHCAFGAIQQNSSVEHDYLTDGFWAMSKDQELPAKGMTASFLVRMEDVTKKVLAELSDDLSEAERSNKAYMVGDSLAKAATEGTGYNASVKSFFEGNEYYLFVYETFTDVRLVGAPPSSIGKFGGDTDNWMWPRQTGDFSLIRIYSGKDGKPASYSKENVPMKPKHHLPVSLSGVSKDDFAMVMGYPGSTDRYLTSYGVKNAIELDQPARVKIRGKKLDIYKKHMDADKKVKIQYASKYARVSNYWKYFIGQTAQLKKNKVLDKKQREEADFTAWLNGNAEMKKKYGDALPMIEKAYNKMSNYQLLRTYFGEAVFGSEILYMGYRMQKVRAAFGGGKEADPKMLNAQLQAVKGFSQKHFKDYDVATDKEVTAAMLEMYYNDIPKDQQPKYFLDLVKKNKNDFTKLTEGIFKKSMLASPEKIDAFVNKATAKALDKDPAIKLAGAFLGKLRGKDISAAFEEIYNSMDKGNRLFVAGLRKWQPNAKFYPNANSTMRLTYGQVLDYYPRDAVYYNYFTTIEGILEKEDPTNEEFIVPAKLKELAKAKDYGQYADKDGKLHVCFLTNNDITGGNSGSPVINAKGELIGCAFDGNWEAMSGDIFFEKNIQRTIVVDIRYVLFIIDKYAGASHLVDELTLVKTQPKALAPVKAEAAPVDKTEMKN